MSGRKKFEGRNLKAGNGGRDLGKTLGRGRRWQRSQKKTRRIDRLKKRKETPPQRRSCRASSGTVKKNPEKQRPEPLRLESKTGCCKIGE